MIKIKIGDYYKISDTWYHKIVGEEGKKFLVLDLTFPVEGAVKATKSIVEYAGEQVTEKEVLDWIVKQMMDENEISIQEKIDEAKELLEDIDKEIKNINKNKYKSKVKI